jgi:hypothetical protein
MGTRVWRASKPVADDGAAEPDAADAPGAELARVDAPGVAEAAGALADAAGDDALGPTEAFADGTADAEVPGVRGLVPAPLEPEPGSLGAKEALAPAPTGGSVGDGRRDRV